jgi:hypothetical protein
LADSVSHELVELNMLALRAKITVMEDGGPTLADCFMINSFCAGFIRLAPPKFTRTNQIQPAFSEL